MAQSDKATLLLSECSGPFTLLVHQRLLHAAVHCARPIAQNLCDFRGFGAGKSHRDPLMTTAHAMRATWGQGEGAGGAGHPANSSCVCSFPLSGTGLGGLHHERSFEGSHERSC